MKRFGYSLLVTLSALSMSAVSAEAQFGRAGFGSAVAVSGGDVLIGVASNVITPGAVYLFRQGSGGWTEAGRLQASDAFSGDGFGAAIAVDGSTMMVSASAQNDGAGAIYVFERSGSGDWQETGRLDGGAAGTNFGATISLGSGTAVVGAPGQRARSRQVQYVGQGTAYVFSYNGGSWTSDGTLSAGGDGTGFGSSVAVHGDEILVGAPAASETGAVYAFGRSGGSWQQTGTLAAQGIGPNDLFGSKLIVAGHEALVSAPGRGQGQGAVFAFQYDTSEGEWSPSGHLVSFDGFQQDGFGTAVALTEEAAWIGAPRGSGGHGAAYVISGSMAEGWNAAAKVGSGEQSGDAFASSIAIDADVAVVGVTGADFGTGTATIYERGAGGWTMAESVMGEVEGFDAVSGGQVDCSSGVASAWDCEEYDLVSFMPRADLAPRGVTVNDVWGWTDSQTGREYALVGRRDGSAFVDISDPLRPRYLGQLLRPEGSNPSTWTDIKTYKDHAFIVADGAGQHGVQVFDLTQLRNVTEPVTFEETAHYDQVASAHNIVINEASGFAYSVGNRAGGETCGGGLHIINIQEPTNPTFAGCFADTETGRASTGYTHDAQCVTYAGPDEEHAGKEICMGANETALSIGDVTDPANTIALSRASYPSVGYAHQGWLTEDHRYYYMNDELDELTGLAPNTRTLIWDVAELDDPVLVGEYFGPTSVTDHNLFIKGDRMYQANYHAGFRIVDISDRENPEEIGFFDTTPYEGNPPNMGGAFGTYPYFESGTVIVTSSQEGLFILRPARRPVF
jgi:choice-of-anchor B domain-containing protein